MAPQARVQGLDVTHVREHAREHADVDWPFALYRPDEIAGAFESAGFRIAAERPQFLMPMALYRLAGPVHFARAAEWPGRVAGLTRVLGSPVIVRADRRPLD